MHWIIYLNIQFHMTFVTGNFVKVHSNVGKTLTNYLNWSRKNKNMNTL